MQFVLTVFGRRDINPYDSDEDMQAAFARVGQFNQMLQDEGHWIVAGGMASPEEAKTISPDGWLVEGPYMKADTFPSGFWIIEAEDEDKAVYLAREAASACANHVELRALVG